MRKPVNAAIAIALSLLPMPGLMLVEWLNRGCGDGLCSFFPGMALLAALAVGTIVFIVRAARRKEQPGWLLLVPLILWAGLVLPLPI